MARPNRLGATLNVNVAMPEMLYDRIQSEVRRQQTVRPGASISMSEVIRTGMIEWLNADDGDNDE